MKPRLIINGSTSFACLHTECNWVFCCFFSIFLFSCNSSLSKRKQQKWMAIIQIICEKYLLDTVPFCSGCVRVCVYLNAIKINANLLAMTCTKRLIWMMFVVYMVCCCSHLLTVLTFICIVGCVRVFKMRNRIYRCHMCFETRMKQIAQAVIQLASQSVSQSVWEIAYTIKFGSLNYE